MEYTIITRLNTFAEDRDPDDETYAEKLVEEQDAKLTELGYVNDGSQNYLMKFGNRYRIDDIYNAIQRLALKDGADLVQFPNGNIGFVGYYNGFREEDNHFQIICRADDGSLLKKYGKEFDYQDSRRLFSEMQWGFKWSPSLYADDLVDYLNRKEN